MSGPDLEQRAQQARAAAEAAGQGHVFEHWGSLVDSEREALLKDLEGLDYGYLSRVFTSSMAVSSAPSYDGTEPARDVLRLKDWAASGRAAEWTQHGYRLIAEGRAAVLLLAGGQGTRLGSAAPKGCYDIGLPSHKSLFQLQAERLLRTQQLAAAATGTAAVDVKPLRWYIMTSAFTHEETVAHFEQHNYFGLKQEQVIFFQQGFLPCFTEDGKLILEAPGRLAKAPDGNGGVYLALARSGLLEEMAVAGVEALDCYCVDNALARLGDPRFIGYCHGGAGGGAGADVGARVVAKAYPEEKVGVFARRAGAAAASGPASALCVLEYSELDPARAAATDPATGHLYFNWSNICMHYFSVPWLRRVASELLAGGGSAYHVARKRIPSVSGPVPGVKLELFIFDTFPLAGERTALVEVDRREEFAPVKNAPGSASDSPDTARAALLSLHVGWVKAAGGAVACAEGVEVSPLLSYGGEGLGQVVGGKSYDTPWADELQRPAA
ncbi:hypothetical protein CHLRE_07g345300v5 [Chlamydomonas reinhardtii]|uniref:UDP-N-acetylglucosamine diphosphorylase n=1 Tax=Chlamydomonas reinhardtii TaxID=3055 RepID=A0A2K3DKW5_CHLRE|nr:uncharacterized protein CHLRE_07g345300v5 [Chlamydomonas reinhardtii]PNW81173.1 hypothetical protein CHLRE_07g345300v5 [Chlamydomonas reinhardtii]